MNQAVNAKPTLDAKLVNCVMTATLDVCRTMAGADVQFRQVAAQTDYKPSGDISAIIGFAGDKGEGVIALSFSMEIASILVSSLLGVEPQTLSAEDRNDGVGELVNMVSGHTKAALANMTGASYNLSLPSVIVGKNHEVASAPKDSPYLVLVFELEGQEFVVQMSFKSK